MARSIPHRELRNNSSEILRAVEAGESFTVTNHGRPVAKLTPLDETLPPLNYRPALTRGGSLKVKPIKVDETIQEILDDMRGDR
ncbi:MAG: type II toxin-antitoxin system prevent-host-death family antitoxin [Thermoleophilaceae bacterium]|nr:type II toxin-antitoxin system prevent-host-death family antitoxin [Thermoleophilaceae bacterium]